MAAVRRVISGLHFLGRFHSLVRHSTNLRNYSSRAYECFGPAKKKGNNVSTFPTVLAVVQKKKLPTPPLANKLSIGGNISIHPFDLRAQSTITLVAHIETVTHW